MRTDTQWIITIITEDGAMKMSVDYKGEMPKMNAYIELLKVIEKWSEKHSTVALRLISKPSIMKV